MTRQLPNRDPAVEAASRAYTSPVGHPIYWVTTREAMIAAAREALKPIREVHKPVLPPGIERCGECDVVWPCETAKLIYTTEDLAR
ncbi:hypothetical protein [Mycolicibacterium peregrinum]|uniref:Uncharacterized protein n=1 Tax=Mycolicibacterium peregrinum TaxID=43304 RepID=A0A4Z0HP27_MYCPR|nr:hypothetical protein [Mycolicibacterium peregrinum]TGB37899.1 hypothetical protein EJD98_25455 [Mycolicibacterium peregrinum]TGB38082.1 hypothetical protein EJD94_25110 [Mycolicibacterium peregrinum]